MSAIWRLSNNFVFRRENSRPVSMVDLSHGVIDLAVSTIKKTQHGVTMATVPEAMRANLEVSRSPSFDTLTYSSRK